MTIQTLSLSVSSPPKAAKKVVGTSGDISNIPGLWVPIELANNCSEEGIHIESDDLSLTNAIRRHFLEHFGHRDLKGIVSDYANDAILIVHGQDKDKLTTKYHGHDEIQSYFQQVFDIHPKGESSFLLKQIAIEQKHGTCIWSAKTPSLDVTEATDTFVFDVNGKISKQFFSCESCEREDPGTSRVVRRGSEECAEFFK